MFGNFSGMRSARHGLTARTTTTLMMPKASSSGSTTPICRARSAEMGA
jgi:hypothetical protein